MGVSRMMVGCFKEILSGFQREFESSSKGILRHFQGCVKEVSRGFQESSKGVSKEF